MSAKADYIIEGENFSDLVGFAAEFTRVFCSEFDATWHGNLDAFNDFLWWPERRYVLLWKRADLSREQLGHGEMAKWLEGRVANCHPSNVPVMRQRLELALRNEGPTMFDVLIEIIQGNAELVELRLE